ncbi:MAG: hypothetical protein C5B50_25110 [Verrucomicrobia bacterium]|nr:MAG: hypothetical protein C5B50_25110 [Verrucomicrobiota bacterium]
MCAKSACPFSVIQEPTDVLASPGILPAPMVSVVLAGKAARAPGRSAQTHERPFQKLDGLLM